MTYTILLIIHLFSAALFIGTLFFWTFIIDRGFRGERARRIDQEALGDSESILSSYTRSIMRINVAIIGISGIFMLHYYGKSLVSFDSSFSYLLSLKVLLGVILIVLFYALPKIMSKVKLENKIRVHDNIHYFMFSTIVALVILSKTMWM